MGIHRIMKTIFAEERDLNQLPIKRFLKHIKEVTEIPGVKIIQGVIEFCPESKYWGLYTQGVFPFDIGGEPYQEYDGARLSRAYAKVRASLGPDEIPRL